MPDKKIPQLTELTEPVNNDELVIYDQDASQTKKITYQNLTKHPPSGFCWGGGIFFTGVKYIKVYQGNAPAGDTVLYTAPSNKRALIDGYSVYNGGSGTYTCYFKLRINSVDYRLTSGLGLVAAGAASYAYFPSIILEPGESLVFNATAAGFNVWVKVMEFDSAIPVYSPKITTINIGNNTVYTVPPTKIAWPVDYYFTIPTVAAATLHVANNTANGATVYWHIVPSGGSPSTSTLVIPSQALSGNTRVDHNAVFNLNSGDYVVINSNIALSNSLAWINVIEVSQ